MHNLLNIAGYLYSDFTDDYSDEKDLGREFWKYMKSKLLDDMTKKIKVSDFIYDKILHVDDKKFEETYECKLSNVKKSKAQLQFVTNVVTQMLKYSDNEIIDW